jgi:hypothetical protein
MPNSSLSRLSLNLARIVVEFIAYELPSARGESHQEIHICFWGQLSLQLPMLRHGSFDDVTLLELISLEKHPQIIRPADILRTKLSVQHKGLGQSVHLTRLTSLFHQTYRNVKVRGRSDVQLRNKPAMPNIHPAIDPVNPAQGTEQIHLLQHLGQCATTAAKRGVSCSDSVMIECRLSGSRDNRRGSSGYKYSYALCFLEWSTTRFYSLESNYNYVDY